MTFFDAHTHTISSDENVLSIINTYPNSTDFSQPFSIGMHPWFINKENLESEFLVVEEKLQLENCFAIGECGLDKIVNTDFELQKTVFKQQIILSEKYKKPVIIHCVKAFQEIIELRKSLKPNQIWVLHGFNKNKQIAHSLLKNGFVLSVGSAIINNKKLQDVVLNISLDDILLETDDSKISIQEIYQKIANIKNIEVEELQRKIAQNFKRIFKR
jgi:TatD DNase family protein